MPQRHAFAARLESLLGALVAPWEFASIDAWRDHIASSARDAVGGSSSQVTLDPGCGVSNMRSPDTDPAHVAEYQREWMPQDPVAHLLSRKSITSYVRSTLLQRIPGLADEFDASPVMNDFYRRLAILDSAGIRRTRPNLTQLTVFTSVRNDPGFVRRASQVMPLVAPAFFAGVQHILNLASIRSEFVRNIDTIKTAIALYDTDGQPLHRNAALETLLTTYDGAATLETLLEQSVHAFVSASGVADHGTHLAAATAGAMTWRWHEFTVSGSYARLGIDGSPPLIMLQVYATPGDETAVAVPRSGQAVTSLTDREREVGILLARGAPNREIARVLGITEHTARRHTERVLSKLGVSSRSAVALALGLLRENA